WATRTEQSANIDYSKRSTENLSRKIWKCDKDTRERLKLYNGAPEAVEDLGMQRNATGNIYNCLLETRQTAYGYRWEYDLSDLDMYDDEEWRFYVKVNKCKYYGSNYGRIRQGNRVLHPHNRQGYCGCLIDGTPLFVHVIIAELFVPNPNKKEFIRVNHLDG